MEECFTQPFTGASHQLPERSMTTDFTENSDFFGPREATLATLRSFARAYRAINLATMPEAPGMVLN